MSYFKTILGALTLSFLLITGSLSTAQVGTLDLYLLSGEFIPGQDVLVRIWLQDQPQYEISKSIKEVHEPRIEEIARQIKELSPEDVWKKRQLVEEMDNENDKMLHEITEAVRQRIDPDQEEVKAQVEALGGKVTYKLTIINAVEALVPFEKLSLVGSLPKVSYVEKVEPSRSFSVESAKLDTSTKAILAPTFWNAGETGAGFEFGIVDLGIKSTINAFQGKTIYCSPQDPGQGGTAAGCIPNGHHATRVTGIAVGNPTGADANKKGVAYGSETIFSSKVKLSEAAAFDWVLTYSSSLNKAVDVINHSRGRRYTVSPADYPTEAQFLDSIVDAWSVLVPQAGGNISDGDTLLCLDARSYNTIVVGAINDTNTVTRTDDIIWEYSTRGPTPSGRKKPDLVAPGHKISSPDTSGNFTDGSGTSFATPHISGAVLLMKDAGVNDPRAIKTILINTAEDKGTAQWDSIYGWGYLDLKRAYQKRSYYTVRGINSGQTHKYQLTMKPEHRVTLDWNRHVGYTSGGPGNVYPLSRLILYLKDQSGNLIKYDSSTTDSNNVRQVTGPSSTQTVIVEVKVLSIGGPSVGDSYAIAFDSTFQQLQRPVVETREGKPERFTLHQNYPNPFNPETTIRFSIPQASYVKLEVYNTLGQLVRTLVDEELKPGGYSVVWDSKDNSGREAASGLYIYRLKAGSFEESKRMVVLK